jgi:hypothetical protein
MAMRLGGAAGRMVNFECSNSSVVERDGRKRLLKDRVYLSRCSFCEGKQLGAQSS